MRVEERDGGFIGEDDVGRLGEVLGQVLRRGLRASAKRGEAFARSAG